MLVLSRKPNEKIRIGKDIVISIVSVSESQVKIGIDAPSDVKILREELYSNLKEHAIEATKHSSQASVEELAKYKINKLKK